MPNSLREDLLNLTSDLIRIPSTADEPSQLTAVIAYARRYLEATPGIFLYTSEEGGKPTLTATLHDTRQPKVLLNGHLDVVGGNHEQFNPTVRDGKLYGRGSQDMKGSCAVLLRLLRDLAQEENPPNVGIQLVTDEEIGGEDGTKLLLDKGWLCDFFLAAEPTNLQICYEQKGIIWAKLVLPGVPAHGSRPWDGQNPFVALGKGLTVLHEQFPPPALPTWVSTVTPTLIATSGKASNQIPAELSLTLDLRYIPEDNPEQLLAKVTACFPGAELGEWRKAAPLVTAVENPYLQALVATTEQVTQKQVTCYREHFGSDARFYSQAGIGAICFGPVGAGLHGDQEWVEIESLPYFYTILNKWLKDIA